MIKRTIEMLRKSLNKDKTIGFVPTMGYLHQGHLSLIEAAKKDNEQVVVSIFVNPTQFAPNEDFDSYPRDIERDQELAFGAGADVIFYPDQLEIYPEGSSTSVLVSGDLTHQLCGASRPSHFQGVTSIVAILFNIVQPTRAYFGQKDAQQVIIIKKMVRDLHMAIEIVTCPIVREPDGLAMSSRNLYLSQEERREALILNKSLSEAQRLVKSGLVTAAEIRAMIIDMINQEPLAEIDYVEVLSAYDLSEINRIQDHPKDPRNMVLAAVAVRFGKTRLIDNCLLNGIDEMKEEA